MLYPLKLIPGCPPELFQGTPVISIVFVLIFLHMDLVARKYKSLQQQEWNAIALALTSSLRIYSLTPIGSNKQDLSSPGKKYFNKLN